LCCSTLSGGTLRAALLHSHADYARKNSHSWWGHQSRGCALPRRLHDLFRGVLLTHPTCCLLQYLGVATASSSIRWLPGSNIGVLIQLGLCRRNSGCSRKESLVKCCDGRQQVRFSAAGILPGSRRESRHDHPHARPAVHGCRSARDACSQPCAAMAHMIWASWLVAEQGSCAACPLRSHHGRRRHPSGPHGLQL